MNFPGGPLAKTSPSDAEGVGLIPGQGAKISDASCPPPSKKKKPKGNRSSIVANSIKTLKIVHIKKKTIFKKRIVAEGR